MGLGKSAQAIRAAGLVGAARVLVVCRAVAIENWRKEISKWDLAGCHWAVTSYESLHKVAASYRFDVLIVDEAHYLKEPHAARTKNVLGSHGAIHKAARTWLLSGTPTPNHFGELWPALFCSGRTSLGYEAFIERFCLTRLTGFGRKIVGSNRERTQELRGLLAPIFLRRKAEDVALELPEIFYQDLIVPKGPVDLHWSKTFIKYVIFKRENELVELLAAQYGIIAKITKGVFSDETFEQIKLEAKSIATLRQYVGLQKVQPVIDRVSEEIDSGAYNKIVLFCHHRAVVEGLRLGLKKYGPVTMYGGTPP